MTLSQVKIAVAAGIAVSGFVLFQQGRQGIDLLMIIAGTIYLYIRWQGYKRERYQARMKNH